MKFRSTFTLLLFIWQLTAMAQAPDSVYIGTYIRDFYDFDLSNNTVKTDLYLWCRYKNTDFNFKDELEFINANEVNYAGTSIEKIGDSQWFFTKASAAIRQDYRLLNYPFDKQEFRISIESTEYDLKDLVFVADTPNSKISPKVVKDLKEWDIYNISFGSSQSEYSTNFGNPEFEGNTLNSSFDILLQLKRKNKWLILFKLITGILVSFTISSCVFFIKPINTDPRFGLCVGGLFAAIGNKYIVEGIVPGTNEASMLDHLHNVTFLFIFIIVFMSVISLHFYEKDNDKSLKISQRLDRIGFLLTTASYLSIFSILIYRAYHLA